MGLPPQNQVLLGLVDPRDRDRQAPIAALPHLETGFIRQRVDQPGLAQSQGPHPVQSLGGEDLTGLRSVLQQQSLNLGLEEITQAQGLGLDVEGAPAGDRRRLGTRVNPVVTQVPHPAQHHRLRELHRPLGIAGPQLSQQGNQRVPDQGIRFVQQQHHRQRRSPAPAGQELLDPRRPRGAGDERLRQIRCVPIIDLVACAARNLFDDRRHAHRHVFPHGLGRLDIGVHRPIASLPVQVIRQRQQTGGLAGLARGVQQKVFLSFDQAENLFQVPALQRGQTVVLFAANRPFGVEKTHGVSPAKSWLTIRQGIGVTRFTPASPHCPSPAPRPTHLAKRDDKSTRRPSN